MKRELDRDETEKNKKESKMEITDIIKNDRQLNVDHPNRVIKEFKVRGTVSLNDIIDLVKGPIDDWFLAISNQDNVKNIVLDFENKKITLS